MCISFINVAHAAIVNRKEWSTFPPSHDQMDLNEVDSSNSVVDSKNIAKGKRRRKRKRRFLS